MGTADSDIERGGSRCLDIGPNLFGGGAIGPAIRVRDMGPAAVHEEGVWRIPPLGGPQTDGMANIEWAGRSMGLPPAGGCDDGGGFEGGRDLHLPPQEHSSAIYCD